MQLIDIHTHEKKNDIDIVICNCEVPSDEGCFSVGIHPWHIAADWEKQFAMVGQAAQSKNVVAIGECGFDTVNGSATIEEQERIFAAHIALSEELQKPLIIHLVKAQELLMKAAKQYPHIQAWIVHGFRGKPTQAKQLLNAGLYLSFGEKFNDETIREVPLDRMFVESDVSSTPLQIIYEKIAEAKNIGVEALAEAVRRNAKAVKVGSINSLCTPPIHS